MFIKSLLEELYITDNFKNGFDDTLDQEKVDVMLEKLLGPMLNWDPMERIEIQKKYCYYLEQNPMKLMNY